VSASISSCDNNAQETNAEVAKTVKEEVKPEPSKATDASTTTTTIAIATEGKTGESAPASLG
jgi:hypothetical protein